MILKRNYISTKPHTVIEVDEIYTIHYFEYIKHFHGIEEAHAFWEMVYVDSGSITALADRDEIVLERGDVCFHAPNEPHNILSANAFSSVFIISFTTPSADIFLLQKKRVTLGKSEHEIIARILSESAKAFSGPPDIMDQTQLVRNPESPYGGEQVIRLLLEQLLIQIIRKHTEIPATQPPPAPRPKKMEGNERYIVDSVVNILTKNLYNRLTLDDICQELLFSKSYAEKLFQQHMGFSIIRYFNHLKINEAKRLVSEGRYSFSEIAELLQFSSLHYFSRMFKTIVGMNPSTYAHSVKARGLL